MRSFPWKWYLKDLPKPDKGKVFSTFACGGGSSMGYKRAGFEMVGCCEIDPEINAVYKQNLHPKHNFLMDLRKFNELADLPKELYELDILDGSPPCSTFSTAGKREKGWGVEKVFREGQAKQTLDDLFFVYLETVRKLKPKVCVAENVTGLVKGNAKGYVNQIAAGFRDLGYDVQLFLLNGAYMEVPQKRERVFFVANRMGYQKLKLAFNYKPVTFGEVKTKEGARVKGDVSDVNGTARLLAKARPGDTSLSDINARERGKANIGFTMNLVWDNMVPATVSSRGGVFRMPEGTEASKGDFVAMGTFPQDYWFADDEVAARRMAHYMVGMSVPPSMTAHIADQIWEQWLKPKA